MPKKGYLGQPRPRSAPCVASFRCAIFFAVRAVALAVATGVAVAATAAVGSAGLGGSARGARALGARGKLSPRAARCWRPPRPAWCVPLPPRGPRPSVRLSVRPRVGVPGSGVSRRGWVLLGFPALARGPRGPPAARAPSCGCSRQIPLRLARVSSRVGARSGPWCRPAAGACVAVAVAGALGRGLEKVLKSGKAFFCT